MFVFGAPQNGHTHLGSRGFSSSQQTVSSESSHSCKYKYAADKDLCQSFAI